MRIHPNILKRLRSIGSMALSPPEIIMHSYETAVACAEQGIAGDFAECGVFAGSQIAAMGLGIEGRKDQRKIHAFDSFCGIPHAGPMDDETITSCVGTGNGELVSTGVSSCGVQQVRGYLQSWGLNVSRYRFYEGWFQETLPKVTLGPLALLRIDADLYESVKVCMEHLHDLVVPGGYVILDDWLLTGARKAIEEFWASRNLNVQPTRVTDKAGTVVYRIPEVQ